MIVESPIVSSAITPIQGVWVLANFWILVLAVLYFIFSLIVIRQVNLMTEIIMTEAAPILRAFSIIHSGLALGIVILLIGFLFG